MSLKRPRCHNDEDRKTRTEAPPGLNPEQQRGWDLVVNQHQSVFITGRAGCGKSHLVRALIRGLHLRYGVRLVGVTAMTGVAAVNIGGVTLHSFSGIKLGDGTADELLEVVSCNKRAVRHWKQTRVLVIDEVSMLSHVLLDKLDFVARRVRNRLDKPWGGLQLVFVGDFFQLPPINTRVSRGPPPYAFKASCWPALIPSTCVIDLRTQMRQQSDPEFAELLNIIRIGVLSPTVRTRIQAAFKGAGSELATLEACGIQPTKLFAYNRDVDALNDAALAELEGAPWTFTAVESGSASQREALNKVCRVPFNLVLKRGAQVMLAQNLDTKVGLVNGARGIVLDFERSSEGDERWPMVQFMTPTSPEGTIVVVDPTTWTMKSFGTVQASRRQVPLRLAYALTIHKSQGMTIDALEVDLAGAFACGQAYVALSRGVALARMRVLNFRPKVISCNMPVCEYYMSVFNDQKRRKQEDQTTAADSVTNAAGSAASEDVTESGRPVKRLRGSTEA